MPHVTNVIVQRDKTMLAAAESFSVDFFAEIKTFLTVK